jgi:S1-C subfamily serine protease
MFEGAVAKVVNSLFPIYRMTVMGPNAELSVVGSGFFVDAYGTFVTVAHVFDNAAPGAVFQYRGRSPDHFQNPTLQVTEVARDNQKDIVIGRVDVQLTHGLDLLDTQVPIGASVCVAGYPFPQIRPMPGDQGLDLGSVRRYFQNAMIIDRATCRAENGRVHEGFMMTEFSLFGMSGGPVVTPDGTVVGMQASVMHPRVSVGVGGREIRIENAVAVGSEHICALLATVREEARPASGGIRA